MNNYVKKFLSISLIFLCFTYGCNFFEPFSRAFNEDEEEVEIFEAREALNTNDFTNAYNRWRKLVSKEPGNLDYRVSLGESILGTLGIDLLDILNTLDVSVNAGQTSSLLAVAPVNKDLVHMYNALDMIDDGPKDGDKGNAGFGYALLAAAKLLSSFDTNGNKLIDTGEITDSSLWTSSTDYDKDGKSDHSGKSMGQQFEADLLASLTNLVKAITVSINHRDVVATTDQNGVATYIYKEYVDAYNAIKTTYLKAVDINNQIANQALSGQALATAIEALDN
ncbi:hypothetical protein ACFL35_15485 [Candidatus Riflebacteria bacterium]